MYKILAGLLLTASFGLILAGADAQEEKKQRGQRGQRGQDVEATFKRLDANSDGKLTRDEFLKQADRIQDEERAKQARERLNKAFDEASGGSDSITLEQFRKYSETRQRGFQRGEGGKQRPEGQRFQRKRPDSN